MQFWHSLVGKTTIVRIVNQKIARGQLRGPIANRRLLAVTGSFNPLVPADHEKLGALLKIVEKTQGRLILFRDELHTLTRGVVKMEVEKTTDESISDNWWVVPKGFPRKQNS